MFRNSEIKNSKNNKFPTISKTNSPFGEISSKNKIPCACAAAALGLGSQSGFRQVMVLSEVLRSQNTNFAAFEERCCRLLVFWYNAEARRGVWLSFLKRRTARLGELGRIWSSSVVL